ncbi:hypothetical protein AG1IA_09721 [Rhizoctonia solani AG-1 IA]|uniref:Uncharacterized protein n=1 Tax=Thanatephorus cucumeris (strain AG1-IA) TaxID=983506 RepID=L8WE90_THACA|nr:hypothetical protein AG1IA_09721 [Rhizoctonia solani AG-1 IA]
MINGCGIEVAVAGCGNPTSESVFGLCLAAVSKPALIILTTTGDRSAVPWIIPASTSVPVDSDPESVPSSGCPSPSGMKESRLLKDVTDFQSLPQGPHTPEHIDDPNQVAEQFFPPTVVFGPFNPPSPKMNRAGAITIDLPRVNPFGEPPARGNRSGGQSDLAVAA